MGIQKLNMKIFIKDPSDFTTQTLYVEDACLVADLKEQISEKMDLGDQDFMVQYGIQTLDEETFLADAGITDEGEVSVHFALDGGKKKRKKKPHTTPKKIPHKHKKRSKSLLDYFAVEGDMKVKRLKQESPNAAGAYMADHPDRYTCGRTGSMYYKLTPDGKRLPIPAQNKKVEKKEEKKVDAKDAKGKKGKKK